MVMFTAVGGVALALVLGAAIVFDPGRQANDLPVEVWTLVQEDVERRGEDGAALVLESAEAVDWPDACLGISEPDRMCAQVIVPGYRILVRLAGTPYEYRTDAPPDWIGSRQARRLPR